MRIVHLYPFVPIGRHGGTLRLTAALSGTRLAGETELHYYDSEAGRWQGPSQVDEALQPNPPQLPSRRDAIKRWAFPSTLWESGRLARRALPAHLERLDPLESTVLFLHTTYLAPALERLSDRSARTVVDAYDLVWRAHSNDAGAAKRRAPSAAARLRRIGPQA